MDRRNFLEWLAISSAGGAGAFSFMGSTDFLDETENKVRSFSRKLPPVNWEEKTSLHVFSKHLQFLDYEGMAEAAAEAGFDGVDLAVRPKGHVEPAMVMEDLPKAVRAIKKQGLQPLMMTTAITDGGAEDAQRTLQVASEQGIKYYRTNWLWYEDQVDIQKNLERFEQQLTTLAKLNSKYNIIGDYQNHAGFSGYPFGGPVWDLALVLNKIGNPYIGCQYDIRHATVEGGTSWPLGLKFVKPHIHTLVVKDFVWGKKDGKWQVINTPIGEGMVDFPKFFHLLKEYEISAPISVHFEYEMPEHNPQLGNKQKREQTIQQMRKDVERLRQYMKEAGL